MGKSFQFTPLREGRQCFPHPVLLHLDISIHAPPRGATISTLARAIWRSYFNSRPSARGDFCNDLLVACYTISIHAPPRGATARRWRTFPQLARFQFTPLREGRRAPPATTAAGKPYFNSRPSARGDNLQVERVCLLGNFNSRPSARGDGCGVAKRLHLTLFQFTPLREGRRKPRNGCWFA